MKKEQTLTYVFLYIKCTSRLSRTEGQVILGKLSFCPTEGWSKPSRNYVSLALQQPPLCLSLALT